ncbi:hypothetical protein MKX01_036321 [Papaver californicum]|nr:hypothetical protein MKX01_036321 [Papaver californicum]
MVQAKSKKHHYQKPKAGKQLHNGQSKKHGKPDNIAEFSPYLDSLGLKIVKVTADGNCFFRAIADQLEGNEEEHNKYRLMVVKYIQDHRLEFEPFIEDEVPFDEYCDLMEKEGTWAGQMELQACSLVTRCNICVHRLMSPCWYMRNFEGHGSRVVHLSYHNEEHYNSVRSKEDSCSGPARPIVIKMLIFQLRQIKVKLLQPYAKGFKNVDKRSIQMVMSGGGCESFERAEEVLQQVYGDVDAAIEYFIAEQILGSDLVGKVDLSSKSDAPDGDCGTPVVRRVNTSESEQTENKNDEKLTHGNNSSQQSGKLRFETCIYNFLPTTQMCNLPRNKICPCGSKKKHKDCCTSYYTFRISTKETGQERWTSESCPSSGSDGGLRPDVGALCI